MAAQPLKPEQEIIDSVDGIFQQYNKEYPNHQIEPRVYLRYGDYRRIKRLHEVFKTARDMVEEYNATASPENQLSLHVNGLK